MNGFKKEKSWIYRLKIPFDTVYTSVFLIRSAFGNLLVDCASSGEDVDQCIVPALKRLGYDLSDIGMLVLTHRHSDHAGGLARVLSLRSRTPEVKAQILAGIVRDVYPKIEAGEVKPTIYKVLSITEAEAAHGILYRGENVGKVVLTVK